MAAHSTTARERAQGRERVGDRTTSVREVCLVAAARPSQAWAAGERVTWSGRVYRVEATQDPAGPSAEDDDATGYVHLTPWPAAGGP